MEDSPGSRDERPFAQAKLLTEEKCPVCGDNAAKHVHYGAMTCFSCRAFFRRSIQNKTADNYVCRRTGTCEINLKTRKNCQFCRFQKCMSMGMKRSSVLTEEERNHRFRKTRDKATSDQDKSEAMDLSDQFEGVNLNRQQLSPADGNLLSPPTPTESMPTAFNETGLQLIPVSSAASKLKLGNGTAHQSHSIGSYNSDASPGISSMDVPERKPVISAASGGLPININGMVKEYNQSSSIRLKSPTGLALQQQLRGALPVGIKQEVITSAEQQRLITAVQQQHNVRLVNGQNPPPQRLIAAANGGVGFKFGGGGLESLHERNNGVIKHSSLKIKDEPNLTSPLRGPRQNSVNSSSLGGSSHHHPHQNLRGQMAQSGMEEEDISPLSPEEALQVVQTVSYDDISNLLGANEFDHDVQGGSTSSGESVVSSSDRCSNSRSPYDFNSRNIAVNQGVNVGLEAPMSESWYNNSSQHQHTNSTTTLASVGGSGGGGSFNGGSGVSSPMPSLSGSSTGATTVDSAPPTPSTLYSSSTNGFDDFTGDDRCINEGTDIMAIVAAAGLQVGNSQTAANKFLPSTACYEPLTDEETKFLDNLVINHNTCYKSVNFGEELIKEMIMCSLFGIAISTRAALTGYRLSVDRITRIAKNLDAFNRLDVTDQEILLKENADLLVSLRGAIFFESRKKGIDQVLVSMGVEDMEKIKSMFSQLMKDNENMKHIKYSNFNSLQEVGDDSKESRYDFLLAKVGLMLTDEYVVVLVTMIVLFSGDFCTLQNRVIVEETQIEFILLLRKYFNTQLNRVDAMVKFANTLEIVSLIREMADIKKSRRVSESVKLSAVANLEA